MTGGGAGIANTGASQETMRQPKTNQTFTHTPQRLPHHTRFYASSSQMGIIILALPYLAGKSSNTKDTN